MGDQHPAEKAAHLLGDADENAVVAAAARLLAEADRTAGHLHHEAAELRLRVEAEIRSDRERLAELSSDLARVHGQLDEINSGIIGLQAHGLRQTGVAALALAVLVAIAWKVIGG